MIASAPATVDNTSAPAPTAAATAPAAPDAPTPPPPAEQLAAVIGPLQRSSDGSYEIRISLRPPELGRVDVRVEMRDGVLQASIHAEHSDTAELLRGALDDLRARLDADGMQSGQLTVDAHGAGDSERDSQTPTQPLEDGIEAAPEISVATTTATTSDSLLDVRI
jgi:flagellar hook-length control protein FliK